MAATKTTKETLTYTDSAGNLITSATRSVTGDTEQSLKSAIAPATVNLLVSPFYVTKSKCQAFVFASDQVVTLLINSTGSPAQTIVLTPNTVTNQPGIYAWNAQHVEADPLAADITAVYISNATAVAANVTLYALHTETP